MSERVLWRPLAICLIALGLSGADLSSQMNPGPATVLSGVTVIDGLGTPPRAGMTIVVRSGRIADLFPDGERPVPSGATRLDAAGKFVMPGLIDAHVHLATTPRPQALLTALMQATLLGGVTSLRDMGGNGAIVADLARAAQEPGAASPAIYSSAVFAGADSMWFTDARAPYFANNRPATGTPWLVKVDRTTNVRDAVSRAKASGATGVKLYSHLSRSYVRDIANEARRQRLEVWSHATVIPATPDDVVGARPSTLSHADYLVWAGRTGVPAELFGRPQGMLAAMNVVNAESDPISRLLKTMRERSVMLEPTLYIGLQAAGLAPDEERTRIDQQVAYAAAVTSQARAAGVSIVAGTDALGGSSPNLHVELQLLVRRAGLRPVEAIRAATFNAARALGKAGDIGSIQIGRAADLVVLEQNPAVDIRNTQTVVMVMRNGVVHQRTLPMSQAPYAEAPPR